MPNKSPNSSRNEIRGRARRHLEKRLDALDVRLFERLVWKAVQPTQPDHESDVLYNLQTSEERRFLFVELADRLDDEPFKREIRTRDIKVATARRVIRKLWEVREYRERIESSGRMTTWYQDNVQWWPFGTDLLQACKQLSDGDSPLALPLLFPNGKEQLIASALVDEALGDLIPDTRRNLAKSAIANFLVHHTLPAAFHCAAQKLGVYNGMSEDQVAVRIQTPKESPTPKKGVKTPRNQPRR